MKVSKKLSILTSLVAISCGQGQKSKKADESAQPPKSESVGPSELTLDPDAKPATEVLPGSVVVRVPVGADGKTSGDPEIRIDTTNADAKGEAIKSIFDKSEAPTSLVDKELDANSSTQSWFLGGLFNRYNNFNSYNNFNYFAPNYNYGYGTQYSYNYSYQQPYNYNYGGYNYYYYPSYNYNAYSYGGGYGYNNNYGGGRY